MQAILHRGLFPNGLSKEKAVSVSASIVVNLAMIVAFASIANIDGEKIKEGAALVVMGLGGSDGEAAKAEKAPAAPAPPPPSTKAPTTRPAPDPAQPAEKPLDQKIALLPPEPVAERSEAAAPPPTESRPSQDEAREAAEQQRRAQDAAKARAAEQAQSAAKAANNNAPTGQSGARSGGSGGYGALVIQHLRRFTRGNSVGAGATLVRISIDGSGGLQDAAVIRTSGSAAFDREALQTVRRASPFPRPPSGEARSVSFEFTGR